MGWKDAPLAQAGGSWQDAPLAEQPKPPPKKNFATRILDSFVPEAEREATVATVKRATDQAGRVQAFRQKLDLQTNDDLLDHAADLLASGTAGFDAGLSRTVGNTPRARRMEALANTPVAGQTSFQDVKDKPSAATIGKFVVEGGVQSLPSMGAAISLLPALIASQTGNIGQQRAVNDGRQDMTLGDALVSLPVATASSLLDRFGATKILDPGVGNAAVRIGKALLAEGGTEGIQSFGEYAGGSVGTERGFDLGTAVDQSLAGALVGAGMGGGSRAAIELPVAANDARLGMQALGDALQIEPAVPQISAPLEPVSQPLLQPEPVPAQPEPVVAPVAPATSWQDAPIIEPTESPAAPAPAVPVDPLPVTNDRLNDDGADGQGKPGESIRVFHGGPGVSGDVRAPFYVTPDKAMAETFAVDRGKGAGKVEEFSLNAQKVAQADDIADAANAVGVEGADSLGGMIFDANFNERAPELVAELQRRGFDAAQFDDYAVDSDDPRPTFAVFNPTAISKAEAEPQPLQDGERMVRTPAGNKVRTRFEVVDASTLAKAEGAMQNRDRSRETTTLQVQDIVSKFDPELLGDDPSSDRGAPIIGADNVVYSGNGRMLALNKIFDEQPEKAAAYRQFIESQGHSTEGIERPVLIRRIAQDMSPDELRQFVVESNKDTKLELSPVERARSDADTITPDLLASYAGGDLNSGANKGFIEQFVKKALTTGEMGNFIGSDRRLTQTGLERVENAVIAAAYDNPKLLERIMENPTDDIRAISGAFADVAPAWAKMRQGAKGGDLEARYDITDQLADAAERVSTARQRGEKIADVLTQTDAFNPMDPVTEQIIRAFYNPQLTRAAGRGKVADLLRDYLKEAEGQQSAGSNMFGDDAKVAPVDILKGLLAKRDAPNGTGLFDDKEKADAGTSGRISDDRQAGGRSIGPDLDAPATGRQRAEREPVVRGLAEDRVREDADADRAADADATDRDGASADADDADGAAPGDEGGDRQRTGARADEFGGRDSQPRPETTAARPDRVEAPRERGAYRPSFEEASFTNRQSVYDSAIQATGIEADKFNLLPPARKARLLADALKKLTGIEVEVAGNMPLQFAIDQLLDAHQAMQGMARALGVSPRALSLGGSLKLKLVKGANFLGSYNHGKGVITLPKRSNSFSHEWGHALDYYLLDRVTDEQARGLSGHVRESGADFTPTNVREGFVNLLNAMFFDGAEIAAKIMRLQQQIERTKGPKTKAALQTQIDNLLSGRSRAKEKSRYWRGADAMNKKGGEGDYWTRPTEMLARAFEAWIGFKLSQDGFGNEFAGKGNDNYLSDSEERFKLTFPKGEERVRIFDAFQKLVDTINAEGMMDAAEASGFNDVATPAMRQELGRATNRAKRKLNPFAADLEAVETWFHNRDVDKEEDSRRAPDPVKIMSKVNNFRALAFSAASDGVKMVATRWGSAAVLKIHDQFAHDLGGTRHVTRAWGDAVEMRENKALNPMFAELSKVGGKGWVYKKLTRAQNDTLAKLLNGETVDDDMGLTRLASIMRRAFNDEWYENRNAGIELGYVNNAGFLNRQIDRELVAGNPDKFTERARQVYEILFDRTVGNDAAKIAADPDRLDSFIALAKRHGIDGVKQLRKMVRDGDIDESLVEQMLAELRPVYSLTSAAEYRDAILHQETFSDHTAAATLPDSEKKRALPAEADRLLRDFYNPSPVSALVDYVTNSVRRTEWNKRFGRPAGAKKNGPTIAEQLDDQMAREGVPASDRRYIWDLVDRMSGRYVRTGLLANPAVAGALSIARVKGTLAMMGRAVTLSTFEPASLGIVTGNPVHGLAAVAKTWANVLHKGSRDEKMEWARAQGFIKHHLLEQFRSQDRFGTTSDSPTKFDKLAGSLFRNTGLTFLTAASDAAVVDVGRRGVLNDMAHRVTAGGARGKEAANLMRELGIRDPDVFARELVGMNDALPSAEWLAGPEGFDYNTALMRLSKMTIQKPDAASLAPLSRNPLASYATYSITSYIQSAYRNLFKRNVKRGLRLAQAGEFEILTRFAAGTLASVATLYSLQFLSSVIREMLFNPERQDDWERKGEWWKRNAALAGTRTFSFGAGDPIINAWTGLRWNRDLAYLPLGAYAGADAQNLTKMAKLAASNSRKNNTAEHNALSSAYNFALAPAISAGINAAPGGGPISTAAGGASIATLTSPNAAKSFASFIVGPKNNSIDPETGEKVKSGPTALDELLGEPEDEDDED